MSGPTLGSEAVLVFNANKRKTRMVQLLIGIAIGIVIGWNWPQPAWARGIQAGFVKLVRIPEKHD